jgi:hypothetical protein
VFREDRKDLALKRLFCILLLVGFGCEPEVKQIEVDPMSINFTKMTQSRKLEVQGQEYHEVEVPGVVFGFSSENTAVTTVDSRSGLVQPAGNGSTAIKIQAPNGVETEVFVKVCLPKAIVCDPADKLALRVGFAAPLKCHAIDCRDEKLSGVVGLESGDEKIAYKDGENVFIGFAVGDTEITAKVPGMEKRISVRVDEQIVSPGMGPDKRRRRGRSRRGAGPPPSAEPKRFDHIIKNMNFGD